MLTLTGYCEPITGAEAVEHMRPEQRQELATRFFDKTEEKPNGCLTWTGAADLHGYGAFRVRKTTARAHRVSFVFAKGPIPPGLVVRHTCHDRKCVNADHLELGTHADNSRDMVEAGRHATGPGSRPRKLTVEDAVAVLGARIGGFTTKECVEMFGVAPQSIAEIWAGRRQSAAIAKHMDEVLGTPETPAVAP